MKGLLDTSVLIATEVTGLPDEAAISAASLAELHFGVHLARSGEARRLRVRRLTEIEARFEPLAIDAAVARSYGQLADVVVSRGKQVRRRVMELLIAATAHAYGIPLYTRDGAHFEGLEGAIDLNVV